ncbi:MAG: DNA-3-methyladenine glycosylase 2 family protein, partial [Burkholderiales bacterium]|nr:DNA-3-methyladenine glycosylase 2 family protein [Burkholderiales bacterium]
RAAAGVGAVRAGGVAYDDETPPLLRLAYRPPLDGDALMHFFAARALPGVEQVEGGVLRRTLALPHGRSRAAGWIECRFVPARCELQLRAAPALAPAAGALLQRVRHAFDLDADPALVDPVLARMPLPPRPGLRLPGAFDGFELAVRAVLGQQVTLAAARTLAGRLVERFGMPLATPFDGLHRLFPDPATLAGADPDAIGALGIVRQRVRALQALASAVAEGRLELRPGAPLAPTLQVLRALPGIGEWTLQLIAMRALAWPDAFPASDLGVRTALAAALDAQAGAEGLPGSGWAGAQTRRGASVEHNPRGAAAGDARSSPMPRPDARATAQAAEAWRPWRAYAVVRLWHALAAHDASRSPAATKEARARAGHHAVQPD